MFSNRITATGVAFALAISAPAALANDSTPSPGAIGAGATAVSSQSLIPTTPSPGATGAGATAISSQSLLPGYYRTGEHGVMPSGSTTRASGFDWADAGIGAGSGLVLGLAAFGSMLVVVRRRSLAG